MGGGRESAKEERTSRGRAHGRRRKEARRLGRTSLSESESSGESYGPCSTCMYAPKVKRLVEGDGRGKREDEVNERLKRTTESRTPTENPTPVLTTTSASYTDQTSRSQLLKRIEKPRD